MYKWQFSPGDSSLLFALTDCPASYCAAQTQFELRSRLLLQNKATIVTCVAPHTARAIHLASPVINKNAMEGNCIAPMPGLNKGRRELNLSKFSLCLTYSTCKNGKKKTTTTKSVCQLHNTSPVSEKPFYTYNGWGIRQTKIQIYFFSSSEHNLNTKWTQYRVASIFMQEVFLIYKYMYKIILKTLNALLCVDGIHITQSKCSG